MVARPSEFVNWVPAGESTKILSPSSALRNQGYLAGQPPGARAFNWLLRQLDLWVQYLDQTQQTLVAWPTQSARSTTTLQNAVSAAATAGGGVILVTEPFNLTANVTIPPKTLLVGRGGISLISFAANFALSLSDDCHAQNVFFTSVGTATPVSNLLRVIGDRCLVNKCHFSTDSGQTIAMLTLEGDDNRSLDNTFRGVVLSPTAVGVSFIGVDNYDRDSIFTD